MSTLDEIFRPLGAPAASKDDPLADIFRPLDAPAAPPPVATAQVPAQPRSFGQEISRQLGLTARAPVQAALEVTSAIGDPLASAYNAVTGRNAQIPSATHRQWLDSAFPTPETPTEQFANRVAAGGFTAAAGVGGAAASAPVGQTGQAVRSLMLANPGSQVAGATAGAGAAEGARQHDLPWYAQLGAGLVAAPAAAMATRSAPDLLTKFENARMGARTGIPFEQAAQTKAAEHARAAGYDWNQLPQQIRTNLNNLVKQSLNTQAPVDPVMLKRWLDLQAAGAPNPTRAMLTRNPADWAREERLAHLDGIGEPIRNARIGVSNAVRSALTENPAPGDARTGAVVREGLRNYQNDLLRQRSAAYQAARSSPEAQQGVPVDQLREYLKSMQMRSGTQPEFRDALRELERLSEKKATMPVTAFEELRKFVNSIRDPAKAPSVSATDAIRHQIDDAFAATGKSPVFREAREMHRIYGSTFKDQTMVRKLTEMASSIDPKVPNDRVYGMLVNADPNQIKQVRNTLTVGGQAEKWQTVKDRVFEDLATTLSSGQTTADRATAFMRRVDNLRDQLPAIFDAPELQRIQQARQAVELALVPPRGTPPNPGTAGALMNYARDVLGTGRTVPFGKLLSTARDRWNDLREVRSLTNAAPMGPPTGYTPAWHGFLTPAANAMVYGGLLGNLREDE